MTDKTSTEVEDSPQVTEEDLAAFRLAQMQEQAEGQAEELKRLSTRVVTLRKVVNDLTKQNEQLKLQLAAAGSSDKRKMQKKGKKS